MASKGCPKVSVCIPTYNYGRFIAEAIESVLAQTFKDFELIVVDNCSTDNTRAVVEHYVNIDPRIVYYCNESNIGMVGNWNRCLGYARGKYIKILCADDYLDNLHLEKCVTALENNVDVAVTSTPRTFFGCDDKTDKLSFSDIFEIVDGNSAITRCLLERNVIGEPTAVMFRKYDGNLLFNPDFDQVSDMEMWFRFLEQGKLANIPDTCCYLRCHDSQTTNINVKDNKISLDELKLYSVYLPKTYIAISWFQKESILFFKAYNYWLQWHKKINEANVMCEIGKHYNPFKFKVLLTAKKFKSYIFKIKKNFIIWNIH